MIGEGKNGYQSPHPQKVPNFITIAILASIFAARLAGSLVVKH